MVTQKLKKFDHLGESRNLSTSLVEVETVSLSIHSMHRSNQSIATTFQTTETWLVAMVHHAM